nr:O-antigen ligase family protein [candidate division Zixibacteria bacterium]
MEISVNTGHGRLGLFLVSIIIIFLVLGTVLIVTDKMIAGLVCMVIPAIVLTVSHPRLAPYFYVFCVFITRPLNASPPILFIDLVAILLIGALVLDHLVNCRTVIGLPAIYKYYLGLLLIMIMSAVFAYDFTRSINPILRVSIQLIMIIVIYNIIPAIKIKRILEFYFWVAVVHAIYNSLFFFLSAGTMRVFGSAGVYFDDLAMLAVPIGLAWFIWQESGRKSLVYGFGTVGLIFGLLATQSRGPMLTIGWVGAVIVVWSIFRARRIRAAFVSRRLKSLLTAGLMMLLILPVFSDIFSQVGGRYAELGDPSRGTIWLRLSLWRTSLITFINNPLTGIGPGNYRIAEELYPFLKFDPARLYVGGLSAHNLFLHYLAETGIFGALCLTTLFYKHFRTALGLLSKFNDRKTQPIVMALFGVGLIIFFTIFYLDGWMWGQNSYVAAFFIAVTAGTAREINSNQE